jgi:hypothetical protein
MEPEDPEKRIRELERRLSDSQAAGHGEELRGGQYLGGGPYLGEAPPMDSGPPIRRRLTPGMTIGLIVVVVFLLPAVVGIVALLANTGSVLSGGGPFNFGQSTNLSVPQGGRFSVGGNSVTRTIACNDGALSLSGNSNSFKVTGHCVSLNVSGVSNHVSVDNADAITASGISNTVIFHAGSPGVTSGGISVTVQQG